MIRTISIVLLCLLLLAFPLGFLFRVRIFQNAYLVPQDIVVFLLFLLTVLKFYREKIFLVKDKFVLFQVLFISVGGVSLIINSLLHDNINILVSFLYLIRYISYLSILNISNLLGNIKFEKRIIITVGTVTLFLGYIQYFFYYDLKDLYYLGWDNHLYRLFSTFLDPNYAGVFYVVFFLILVSLILRLNFKNSYLELMLSFFTLIAVYLTYSRTALVSLLSGIVALGILSKKITILIISFIFFSILLVTLSDTSIEGLNPLRTASSIERLTSIKEASKIISDNPVMGVGFNAYRYAQLRLGLRSPLGAAISNADAGTDNSFLFVFATTGVIGGTFFILSYYYLLKKLFEEKKIIGFVPFCIVIALLFGSMFLNVFFYTPIMTFFYLLIAFRSKIFAKN